MRHYLESNNSSYTIVKVKQLITVNITEIMKEPPKNHIGLDINKNKPAPMLNNLNMYNRVNIFLKEYH